MRRNYFRIEEILLKVAGASVTGNESAAYKIYSFVVICLSSTYPVIACGDLFKHDFTDNARVFLYIVCSIMGTSMILAVLRNRIKLGELFINTEKKPFLPNEEIGGSKEQQLVEEWSKVFSNQRRVLYTVAVTTVTLGMAYAVILRIRFTDYQKWTFNYGPLTILNVTYSPNYEILLLYQNICISLHAIIICVFSITCAGVLSFASVQFQLLQNYLKNIVDHSREKELKDMCGISSAEADVNIHSNTAPPWKYLQAALKEAVIYHLKIFELVSEAEEIFSIALLVTFFAVLGILCFVMYINTYMLSLYDISTYKLLGEGLTAILLALLMCYWGEQVAHESEMVALAAYESNLVGTDPRFQKALLIIIQRSQRPLRIKAGKFIDTSLVTYAWILRTAYSCFMVLSNVKQL